VRAEPQCFSEYGGEPLENCDCFPACASCGYKDAPTGPDMCLACQQGLTLNARYDDGTGSCDPPDCASPLPLSPSRASLYTAPRSGSNSGQGALEAKTLRGGEGDMRCLIGAVCVGRTLSQTIFRGSGSPKQTQGDARLVIYNVARIHRVASLCCPSTHALLQTETPSLTVLP
jgi:hypothetical protein